MTTTAIAPTAGDIDLNSKWDTLLSAFESSTGSESLFTVLGVAGVLIVIIACASWAISKRRGNTSGLFSGQDGLKLGGAIIAGVTLAAPKVIIPVFLWIVDLLGNAFLQVVRNSGVDV